MWLYVVAFALLIFGIVGGIFGGGIFTIVLVPLAVLIVISAVGYGAMGQKAGADKGAQKAGGGDDVDPLPHQPERTSSHTLASPEQLADERRVRQ